MIAGLVGVNHGCFNVLMAENPAHSCRVNAFHLHQAIKCMSKVVNAGEIIKSGKFGDSYQSSAKIIRLELLSGNILENISVAVIDFP